MLTISSIGVAPWPSQGQAVKAQPVDTQKPSNVVSREGEGKAVAALPAGDGGQVQAVRVPTALPPVAPPREAVELDRPEPAQVPARQEAPPPQPAAQQQIVAESVAQRFKGQLPPEVKNPADAALDEKLESFIPNLWLASRAAVDVLIGEEAVAAAAAAAERAASASARRSAEGSDAGGAQSYAAQGGQGPARPGSVVDTEV